MSKFEPAPDVEREPEDKFAIIQVWADGPHTAKNGEHYYKFTFQGIPWVDPNKPITNGDAGKVQTWKTNNGRWNKEFQEFWKSIYVKATDPITGEQKWVVRPEFSAVLKNEDELFSLPGEPTRFFQVRYQTPVFLIEARPDDIQYAKDNNRPGMLVKNEIGQWMKKTYPWIFKQIYADRAEWETDAQAHATQSPAPAAQPTPQPAPERQAVLATLPIFVKNSNFDLGRLAGMLVNPPLNLYVTIDSPEVKIEVARQIVARYGHDMEAIAALLAGMNGYLAIDGNELGGLLEDCPF